MLTVAAAIALLAWAAVLLAPFHAYSTRERLDSSPDGSLPSLRGVSVLIPARNEAAVLERTLRALTQQGTDMEIVVVDDDSEDHTAAIAARFAPVVQIVAGQPLPEGWAGKLWALEQGLAHVKRGRVLLLDADIELAPGMVAALLDRADAGGAVLVSVMARLRTDGFWERLLIPAFIFFFKLLYPFALVNAPERRTAAAAGGCMLVETEALRGIGGFAAMRDALIDDCTLAKRLKGPASPVWLGLTHSAVSLRGYGRLGDLWNMVARSAFTQLRYSVLLLLATTVIMLFVFAAPVVAILAATSLTPALYGVAAFAMMTMAYSPTVDFYRLSPWWTLTLPLAGLLFLAMTWSSAWSYWRGTRATWKNRRYGSR